MTWIMRILQWWPVAALGAGIYLVLLAYFRTRHRTAINDYWISYFLGAILCVVGMSCIAKMFGIIWLCNTIWIGAVVYFIIGILLERGEVRCDEESSYAKPTSRGEFIVGAMTLPALMVYAVFTVFGRNGISVE